MDISDVTAELEARQDFHEISESSLSPEDRRLLLGASLRLFSHRFSCGKPILQDDLIRVASLADDAVGRAA